MRSMMLLKKKYISRSIVTIGLHFLLFIHFLGCSGMTLKDHEPSSPDESAINEILLTFQNGWNQQKHRT